MSVVEIEGFDANKDGYRVRVPSENVSVLVPTKLLKSEYDRDVTQSMADEWVAANQFEIADFAKSGGSGPAPFNQLKLEG